MKYISTSFYFLYLLRVTLCDNRSVVLTEFIGLGGLSLINNTFLKRTNCFERIKREPVLNGSCPVVWDGKSLCLPPVENDIGMIQTILISYREITKVGVTVTIRNSFSQRST